MPEAVSLTAWSWILQAAKKRDFMTGSTIVHSEVRPSMLSSARLAFTQQYGELSSPGVAGHHPIPLHRACPEPVSLLSMVLVIIYHTISS